MDKKKKIIFIISIISIAIIALAGATVAFFGWRAEEESTIAVTVIGGEGSCSLKEDNQLLLEPTTTKNNGRIIKLTGKQQLAETAPITWTMVINEIGGLQHETFKYEFINSTTGVSYGSGDFSNITSGSTITFSNSAEKLEFNIEYEFTLYLWVDGLIGNNPLSMADQTLDFDINCSIYGTYVPSEPTPLSDFTYYLGSEYSTVESIAASDVYYIEGSSEFKLAPISLEENEVLLVRYNGESTDVAIPDTYNVDGVNYNVIVLSYADDSDDLRSAYGGAYGETGIFLYNENIKNVYFGDNVKSISSTNYITSDETDIYLSENTMHHMFWHCKNLINVSNIPDSVTNMDLTFEDCTSLVNAPEIPDSVTSMQSTFEDCASLINAPAIPNSVTNMSYTFYGCTSLVNAPEIPDSVTNMKNTFYKCTNLTGTVRINSSNVSTIENIFHNTSKEITVEVPAGTPTYTNISALTTSNGMPSNVTLSTFTPLSDFAYYLGSEYSTVETTTDGAFTDGSTEIKLAPISLEDNEVLLVRYKGESTDVAIPDTYNVDGVTYNVIVLSYAYSSDDATDTYEETGVFTFNNNIKNVYFGDNVNFITNYYEATDYDLDNAIDNTHMFVYENYMEMTFYECANLVSVSNIPNTVVEMRDTFSYCQKLVNAPEIPDSVTNMSYTFLDCGSLVNAPVIPNSVTDMSSTFSGCTNLTGTVRINSSNVTKATYIFDDTSKAITVEVPAGSTTYTNISALTIIDGMPSNVTLSTFDAS